MTKKDYQLIARVVATITDDHTRWAVGDAFAKVLKADNPRFSIVMFLKACKVWDGLGRNDKKRLATYLTPQGNKGVE